MRKPLFCAANFSLLLAALFLLPSMLSAQCGANSFPSGGALNPTTTWTNAPNVGSGTYVDFNISNATIYSFRYTNNPNIGGNTWDMTLSQGSTPLAYNNSLSPVRDSWTGGELCGPARPSSTDWFSSYNGTVRINTNTWNGSSCVGFVSGQNSAILQYKTCTPAADPGIGVNSWNVEAFVTTDINIPNPNARYGYYNSAATDFITATEWAALSSPSSAPGWVGCAEVPVDNFTLRARRTGFPCGIYRLDLLNSDDKFNLSLNGTSLYSSNSVTSNVVIGDPNGIVLGATDNIEIRLVGLCSPDQADLRLVPITNYPPINPGSIGSLTNSNVCENAPIGYISSTALASGGVSAYTNGGGIIYSWEFSTDGGATFNNVANQSNPDFNTPYNVPPNATYVLRRRASDKCGNTAVSNSITFVGRPAPNGTINTSTPTICPGTQATLVLSFNTGLAPFDISYTDGVNTFTATGVNTGSTLTVTPPTSSTTYSFTSITDGYGCVRTASFTGGTVVNTIAPININSVTPTQPTCFGGNTGSITINATGGQAPLIYSIDNGATFQNSNVFTGLAAGTYNVVVQDNFGCSQPAGTPVVVSQPTAVAHTTTFTDASCAGVFDGSITITASGGTPSYSYSLNGGPTQPGNVFSGLLAGTYNVSTYDANGCSFTSSVTIGSTYVVGVTVQNQTDVTCFGAANGTVTVQVVGGVPPYDYSLNGVTFQTSGSFVGLAGGTYNIIGRDSKGCTDVAVVTIVQPTQVTITIDSVVDVLCFGAGSGAIYMTPSGGTPGYTFAWSNGTTTEDNTTNVSAGVYNVTVTDANGCFASAGATVAQPLELFLNVAQFSNPLCFNDTTGTIDITANGGVPPYAYAWSNGATTEDVVNLPGGVTYTATVTDANGCTKTISQALTQPTPITSSVAGTNVTCNGASDGSADLTVSGGTAPYQFQWSTFDGTEDVQNLSGGLYFVYITDFNGCVHRDSVFINEPAALTLTTLVSNISCFNSNDGAIDLTVTGGTPGYTYAWSNGATTQDLSNLGGATYAVTVTDANGCTASTSVLLVNPPIINTSFVVKNPLCFMDTNGLVDLIPSGGTPPYTYLWNPTGATTEDLTAVPAGTYTVNITDSKGCVKVDSATLTQPSPLVTSGFITNVTCNGYCDGVIDVTAYGGTLPYSFQWSTAASTEDIIALCGGNYFVTVTDVNGCTASTLYPVLEPAPLVSTMAVTNVTCFGTKTGSAAVTPSGGTTPYTYLWNNFDVDSSLTAVSAGTYVVLVTDSNGCYIYDTATITEPTQILVTGVVTNAACFGATTGAIDITATGGSGTFTYLWSNGATTEDLTGIAAGTYTVTVTDGSGCTATASFTVTEPSGVASNIAYGSPTCFNGTNGFIDLDITGGAAPYTYSWNTTPVQTGHTAFNLAAGSYSVTVTDANGCSTVLATILNNPTQLTVTANGVQASCYNTPTGEVTATVTGGAAPYVFQLNGVIQASDTFRNLTPGQYVIAVRDANGCEATDVFQITSPSEVNVDLTVAQPLILDGMTTQLLATSTSTSPIVQHIWAPDSAEFDFSACTVDTNCAMPYVTPHVTTTYVVTVVNQDGCTATDTVTVVVEIDQRMFNPTAFTPNGDGLNDRFEFDILGALNAKVEIFDRWGALVYSNDAQPNGFTGTNGWDGTVDGKQASPDTYVYQLKVNYYDGKQKDVTGTITLMK